MTAQEQEYFKGKLVAEKKVLEEELAGIAKKVPGDAGWEPTSGAIEVDTADENELADKLEEYEGNSGIMSQLENQLKDVNDALSRIEKGSYGLCETCGKPIEKERLEANPGARISIKHGH